jgi:hypothetical protein
MLKSAPASRPQNVGGPGSIEIGGSLALDSAHACDVGRIILADHAAPVSGPEAANPADVVELKARRHSRLYGVELLLRERRLEAALDDDVGHDSSPVLFGFQDCPLTVETPVGIAAPFPDSSNLERARALRLSKSDGAVKTLATF